MIHFRMLVVSLAIRNGKWNLTTLRGSFSGKVVDGEIFNKANNTFEINGTLRIQKNGNGEVKGFGSARPQRVSPNFRRRSYSAISGRACGLQAHSESDNAVI